MEKPRINIIIPSYGATEHLVSLPDRLAAIERLALPIECTLVLSGVRAADRDHLLGLTAKLPNANVLLFEEKLSPGIARNVGLEQASCPYVAFLDVDDHYDFEELLALIDQMHKAGADVAAGSYRVQSQRDPHEIREYRVKNAPTRVLDLCHRHAAIWRYAFRRQWLIDKDLRFSALPLGEDLMYVFAIDVHKPRLIASSHIHYTYVVDQPTQVSGVNANVDARRLLLAELSSRAAEPSCEDEVRLLLAEWFLRTGSVGMRNRIKYGKRFSVKDLRVWYQSGAPLGALFRAVPYLARTLRRHDASRRDYRLSLSGTAYPGQDRDFHDEVKLGP